MDSSKSELFGRKWVGTVGALLQIIDLKVKVVGMNFFPCKYNYIALEVNAIEWLSAQFSHHSDNSLRLLFFKRTYRIKECCQLAPSTPLLVDSGEGICLCSNYRQTHPVKVKNKVNKHLYYNICASKSRGICHFRWMHSKKKNTGAVD